MTGIQMRAFLPRRARAWKAKARLRPWPFVKWLSLAATPAFASMALLTGSILGRRALSAQPEPQGA